MTNEEVIVQRGRNMIKVAICDEIPFAEELKKIILSFYNEKDIKIDVDIFCSYKEFIKLHLDMIRYQIVFMDINMDGYNGIETALKFRMISETAILIFVTAFIEYALEGYKAEALRYILKNDLNFEKAVYESLEAASRKLNSAMEMVAIPFKTGIKKFSADKVVYIESALHNLNFYILEDEIKKYVMRGTMADSEQYVNSKKMLQIHQSYRVNLDYCDRIVYNKLILNNGLELPVSKRYSKEARNCFYNYKGEI